MEIIEGTKTGREDRVRREDPQLWATTTLDHYMSIKDTLFEAHTGSLPSDSTSTLPCNYFFSTILQKLRFRQNAKGKWVLIFIKIWSHQCSTLTNKRDVCVNALMHTFPPCLPDPLKLLVQLFLPSDRVTWLQFTCPSSSPENNVLAVRCSSRGKGKCTGTKSKYAVPLKWAGVKLLLLAPYPADQSKKRGWIHSRRAIDVIYFTLTSWPQLFISIPRTKYAHSHPRTWSPKFPSNNGIRL